MKCHDNCGWCCIKFSISPCSKLPKGKHANIPCEHLTEDRKCAVQDDKPLVCSSLPPNLDMCGSSPEEAKELLNKYL